MISIPTTLILGAGASYPYGFPLGSELVRRILNPIDQDRWQLNELSFDDSTINEFIRELRIAEPPSIDFFLEHRREFIDIGRFRISQELMKCEIADKLNSCDSNKHWYKYFIDKITASPEYILDNKVKIITFNYDRSFETYLYQTLKSRYGREMIKVIESLDVNHVHGKLGNLAWQSSIAIRDYLPDYSIDDLKTAADGIKIIFEADGNSEEFIKAKETLLNSKRIYFLGFGYHEESLQRLGFSNSLAGIGVGGVRRIRANIYGSAFGFTKQEVEITYKNLGRTNLPKPVVPQFKSHVLNEKFTALEFLRNCDDQLDRLDN